MYMLFVGVGVNVLAGRAGVHHRNAFCPSQEGLTVGLLKGRLYAWKSCVPVMVGSSCEGCLKTSSNRFFVFSGRRAKRKEMGQLSYPEGISSVGNYRFLL